MHVQTLVPQATVKRFNEGIFHGFTRPNEVELDAPPIGPIFQRSRLEFRPMIDRDRAGRCMCAQPTIEHPTDCLSVIRNPASSMGLWRLQLSTTVKTRNGRPSARVSCTKSMLQRSVGPSGSGPGHDAGRCVSVAGPACAAVIHLNDTSDGRVCDSPASPPAAATPRSADSQTEAGHGPDPECATAGRFDPSRGSVDTRRRGRTAPADRPAGN